MKLGQDPGFGNGDFESCGNDIREILKENFTSCVMGGRVCTVPTKRHKPLFYTDSCMLGMNYTRDNTPV
jgi:hypothetical protein